MIEVTSLTVRFAGVTPLDDVSVVFPGGTCGLIGPNGAGKTTFFNVLSGFVKPATGAIAAFGDEPAGDGRLPPRALGPAPDVPDGEAIEKLSVFDNVAMIHEHSGAKRSTRRADVLAAIEFVGLEVPPKTKVGGLGAARAAARRGRARRRRQAARGAARRAGRRPAATRRRSSSAR